MLSCDVLVEGIRNEDIKFDMNNFMNDIVLADISDNGECTRTHTHTHAQCSFNDYLSLPPIPPPPTRVSSPA